MHALETIAAVGAQPFTKSEDKNNAVVQAGLAITAAFGRIDNSLTRCVFNLAMSPLTCAEYAQAETWAINNAKQTDQLAGWQAPEGAKGAQKYGPRQLSMSAQASMRRQLFGALKLNLDAIVSVPDSGVINPDTLPTFVEAVRKAREYLDANKIKWDGSPKLSAKESATNDADNEAWDQARKRTMQENPRQKGETIEDYQARINEAVVSHLEDIKAQAEAKRIAKLVDKVMALVGTDAEAVATAMLEKLGYTEQQEEAPF